MKISIDISLQKWLSNWIKENKEYRKIPKTYWMDLKELDYQKWKDSYPKDKGFRFSLSWATEILRFFFWGFLFYVIADVMNYSIIKVGLLTLGLILLKIFLTIFTILLLGDIILEAILQRRRKRHALFFYKRLKKNR